MNMFDFVKGSLAMPDLTKDAADFVIGNAQRILESEQVESKAFKAELKQMSVDDLSVYIPDVYQEDIYKIDYEKLWANGVRMISYDIDDTIDDVLFNNIQARLPGLKVTMPPEARKLFHRLKSMGFTVALLTNAQVEIAADTCADLKADGYIARAEKPDTKNFETLMARFNIANPTQMAHVGNSIHDDIGGGNRAGVITCLVRRAGVSMKAGKALMKMVGIKTRGHRIRKRLLEQNLWRKHHKYSKGDQYYQLGEIQQYSPDFKSRRFSGKGGLEDNQEPEKQIQQKRREGSMGIVSAAAPLALSVAKRQFKKYLSKDHGSKVKKGAFAEASIEMYGNQACIVLDETGRNVLLLTSDNVQSYEYVKEKKRTNGLKVSTYYYYTIYYTDGSSSYVRMRRKYCDAMTKYC